MKVDVKVRLGAVVAAVLLSAWPARGQEPSPSPSAPPEAAPPSPAPSPSVPPAPPPPWLRRIGANDKRRTMRSYPANLAYNAMGVVSKGNRPMLGAAVGLGAMAYPYDEDVELYFAQHPHEQFGKTGQALGGGLFVGVAVLGAFSIGRVTPWDHFRSATYDMSQATVVNLAYTFALKVTVRRERPNQSDNYSFPSGHASNAFATAAVLERHYGWKVGAPAFALATYIATSRLAAEKHFLSDVAFGAAFGFGVGRTVVRRNSRPPTPPGQPAPPSVPPKDEKKTVQLALDPGPSGDGRGLRLTLRF